MIKRQFPLCCGKKQNKKCNGIFHGGVPPAPLPWKIINLFSNNFLKNLFCGLIALKHIVYDASNSQLKFWLSQSIFIDSHLEVQETPRPVCVCGWKRGHNFNFFYCFFMFQTILNSFQVFFLKNKNNFDGWGAPWKIPWK